MVVTLQDHLIEDEELAYLIPAKAMAMTVIDLLFDNAAASKEILKNFKAPMSKESYLEFMESNNKIIKS